MMDVGDANEVDGAASRFAAVMQRTPRNDQAPVHPQLKAMTEAFNKINEILATANDRRSFASKEMSTVAGHFAEIGKVLNTWR